MTMMRRREFLSATLATGMASLAEGKTSAFRSSIRQSQSVDSRIEILLGEPIGRIAPEIYGHFAEHLGGVIYDGIWVGEDSRIPNISGIRKSLVEAMRRIKPSVVRWPGGCFADSYDWRDGIGPKGQRPRRTNFWAGAGE